MTPAQLKSALAAAALRLSRSTPGVSLSLLHMAVLEGADLALKFSAAEVKFEREELAHQRDTANLPN